MSDDIAQLSSKRLGAALAGATLAVSTMSSVALAAQLTQDPTLKATLERQTLNSVLGASQGSIGPQGPQGEPGPPGGAITGLNLTSPTLGVLDDAQIITSEGTTAAIADQGALATLSSLAYGGPYLTGFGTLAGESSLAYGSSYLTNFGSLAGLSNALGLTAGGIVGQAAIATTGAYANLVSVPAALGLTGGYLSASYMAYSTSVTVQSLQPAQVSADKTSSNTAAAIANQTYLATATSLAFGSSYLTGFGAVAGQSVLAYGSSYLSGFSTLATLSNALGLTAGAITGQAAIATTGAYANLVSVPAALGLTGGCLSASYMAYSTSVTVQSLQPAQVSADKTSSNTAAAIANQTYLATATSLAFGSSYLTGFGAVAGQSVLAYGSSYLSGFSTLATLSNALGLTAGAITGQAAIATTGAYANLVSVPAALGLTGGCLSASYMAYSTSVTVQSLQPAQVSADKTSSNTAAAIANQTYLATATSLAFGSSYLTGFGAVAGQSVLAYGSSYLSGFSTLATLSNALGLTAGAITGQAAIATTGSYNNLSNVPGSSQNACVNSDFKKAFYGWSVSGAAGATASVTQPNGSNYMYSATLAYAGAIASGSYVDILSTAGSWIGSFAPNQYALQIVPNISGQNIFFGALLGQKNCTAQLYLLGFNATGTLIEGAAFTGAKDYLSDVYVGNGDPAHYNFVGGVYTTVSTSTRWFALMLRLEGTGASSSSNPAYAYCARMQLGILASGQTTVPPYMPGPSDPYADQTSTNTSASFVGQGTLATQNTVTWQSQFSSMPNWAADIYLGNNVGPKADYINNQYTGTTLAVYWPATTASDKTGNAIAAAITSQGSLATQNAAAWSSQLSGMPAWSTDTNPTGASNGLAAIKADYVHHTGNNTNLAVQNQYVDGTGRIFNSLGLPLNNNLASAFTYNPAVTVSSATTTTVVMTSSTVSTVGTSYALPSGTVSGLSVSTTYAIFYDMTTTSYVAVSSGTTSYFTNPNRYLFAGYGTTTASGSSSGGGTTPYCPAPEGLILLSDLTQDAAENIKPGDEVRCRHEHTGEWVDRPVTYKRRFEGVPRLKVSLKDGRSRVVGLRHKYQPASGGWIDACDLRPGYALSGSRPGIVESIEPAEVGSVIMLTVEDAHTYELDGLTSHNKAQP